MRKHLIQVKSEMLQTQNSTWKSVEYLKDLKPKEAGFSMQNELAHLTDNI